MSDELDQKRREKIENFKVHFSDDFDDISSSAPAPDEDAYADEPKDYSINLESGSEPKEGVEELFTDIEGGEITSHSGNTPPEAAVDEKSPEMRAAKRVDKQRRRIKAKRNRMIFRMIWMMMILFTSIMLAEYVMVGVNDMLSVGREEEKTVSITIPKNATLDQITEILTENKVINCPDFFKLYATVTKATKGYTQGTFDIKTNKDYQAIINYMQSDMNRTDIVTLRFREGISILEIADMLEQGKVCGADDFLKKCQSTDFDEDYEFLKDIKNASQRYYRLEGYLFPDTYDFYVGEEVDSVIHKFLSNYRRKLYLTKIRFVQGEKKQTVEQRAEELGMTMEEVVNLASLIQAEAANTEDMYVISSILHNRLDTIPNDGVNDDGEAGLAYLQLDSTVFYPYRSENQVPAAMRGKYISRYSTYANKGLPAGPICNPGLEAVQAAVNPDDTDYYYFCHKAPTEEEGAVPYYAKTNSEHLANQEAAGLFDNEDETGE